jgi:pSer/pThr/pTyr-binding forkhead associated (FHA) protein
MPAPPPIVVQIIHIEGPLKGQIQEFSKSEISIGRHPSCDVRFPAECGTISREHAKLLRERNQFRLTDISANGTFVNGKKIDQIHLKDGDVITIAPNGPKVSFLTKIEGTVAAPDVAEVVPPQQAPLADPPGPETINQLHTNYPIVPTKAPLTIQYGPRLESFDQLPVDLGKAANCAFIIDHPGIKEVHAQLHYTNNQYWIKDLTGQRLVRISDKPVENGMQLNAEDEISLSPDGPFFLYLGNGHLAEVEK